MGEGEQISDPLRNFSEACRAELAFFPQLALFMAAAAVARYRHNAARRPAAAQQPVRIAPSASRVHWVRPELVAEVKYLTWTGDNLLRQVVYVDTRALPKEGRHWPKHSPGNRCPRHILRVVFSQISQVALSNTTEN